MFPTTAHAVHTAGATNICQLGAFAEGREDSLEENTASLGFYLTAPSYFPYAEAREHAMRTSLTGARRKGPLQAGVLRGAAFTTPHAPH